MIINPSYQIKGNSEQQNAPLFFNYNNYYLFCCFKIYLQNIRSKGCAEIA